MCLRSTARVLAFLVVLLPSQAQAQRQRLFVYIDTTLVELDTAPSRLGAVLHSWSLPAPRFTQFVPLAGGRYLAWLDGDGLKLFDLVTASTSRILPAEDIDVSGMVAVDSEGKEVTFVSQDFHTGTHTLLVLDERLTLRRIELPAGVGWLFRSAYASEARLLMVLRGIGNCGFFVPCSQWIDVVNLADGTIREQAFSVPFVLGGQQIATNGAGTRVWVSAPAGYGAFDVVSGRLIAVNTAVRPEARSWVPNRPNMFVDDRSNVILTVSQNGLVGLDAETLQQVAAADVPKYRLNDSQIPPSYRGGFSWDVMWHPDAAAIYAFESSWIETGDPSAIVTCKQGAFTALDPRTGDRVATKNLADLTGVPECSARPLMTVAPAAPQNLAASVSGRTVTLTLDRPAGTTHYELEVGSAPGLRDLVVTTVPSFPITVEAAPPGTYYVRARALNYAGKGAYSREIRVTVP